MYALDGDLRFPIYWTNNSLSMFDFDYDKLYALEIRALSILDALWIVKVKDLLIMANDPE